MTKNKPLFVLWLLLVLSPTVFAVDIVNNQPLPDSKSKIGRQVTLTEALRITDKDSENTPYVVEYKFQLDI